MLRILLSISSMLAPGTPSPQKAAMPSPSIALAPTVQSSITSRPEGDGSAAPSLSGRGVGNSEQAALGQIPEPSAVAKNAAPGPLTDSPAEARGRRILSTAFVRVGPDGHLTVELRNGRVLVLRDVVMRPKDYCGVHVAGDPARAKYCGGYAEVTEARPGGVPAPDRPDLAVSNSVEAARGPTSGK